jgi:DNA-binding transcriptional LysR family regulator
MTVELRHLRAFAAIADRGSITRAAAALHVSQPALSRTLAALEAHLGVALVDRSTHHLALTGDGVAFLAKVRVALQVVDDSLDVGRLHHWPLRLGHTWAALGEATTPLLRRWERRFPRTPLELHRIDEPTAGLATGAVDVAILRGPVEAPGLASRLLTTEPRVAALPVDSPLASDTTLRLVDLAGNPLVLNTVSGTTRIELWPEDTRPGPTVAVSNTDDWLATIAAGRGVGVTPAATPRMYANAGVAFVPLSDAPPVDVWLVWRDPPTHPLVPDLVRTALEVVAGTA